MSKSVHQFEVRGVDKTGAAFSSVKGRAVTTSAQIKKMVGSALAGLGAYMGLRSIKNGIDELSHLSNTAVKAGVSVNEMTKAVDAFKVVGIQNMGVDQFAKALMFMEKNTGLTGLEGFQKVVVELSKIPDLGERSKAAMSVFGRSYQEFMPLINAGEEGARAFQKVCDTIPGISDEAARSGNEVSHAMAFVGNEVKSIWYQALGAICGWFSDNFEGGIREAAANGCAHMEYYLKRAFYAVQMFVKKASAYLKRFGDFWGAVIGAKMAGASWDEAFNMGDQAYRQAIKEYEDEKAEIERQYAEKVQHADRKLENRVIKARDIGKNIDKSTNGKREGDEDGSLLNGKASKKIVNDLVMAGSNAALKMQVLGPTYQSETKKQTAFLEKIAANTEKTANNTEDGGTGEGFDTVDT